MLYKRIVVSNILFHTIITITFLKNVLQKTNDQTYIVYHVLLNNNGMDAYIICHLV